MATQKKKEHSWDEIGELIGRKIEKEFKSKDWEKGCPPWHMHHDGPSGFPGRLIFIIGVLWALSSMGYLAGVELWQLAIIVIGFALMRF
ncbi:MAG: hypothetical protein JW834_04840 [Candidatus Diapherotrites archaeon]|nr:hypothetical protein [Candidatus Diapherotrites archaeon]